MTRRGIPALAFALGTLLAPLIATPTAAATADVTSCGQGRTFHDLNGDGYVDAVVGDPYATVNDQVEAGTVTVLFGSAEGRIGEGSVAC